MITIRMLGELEVLRDGAPARLPPSKRTRALLAYLAATGKRHRRERLCELLWEVPDDPKGALRWSLSKLRSIVDDDDRPRILADRQSVGLDAEGLGVDLSEVRSGLSRGVDGAGTDSLVKVAQAFRGPFLAGLDLPTAPGFQAWLVAHREEIRNLHGQVLTVLADRLATDAEAALPYVRRLVELDPYDEAAWARLVRLLRSSGRRQEADEQYEVARRMLAETGGATHVLEQARREAERGRKAKPVAQDLHQEIRFCRAQGGARIAYAVVGKGPPLVKTANWMNHLEFDWESPSWGHFFRGLAQEHTLIRYDARGNGLSDWDAGELSLDAWVSDLEAVIEAAGLERFPLLGVSQGCAISVAYAARHPEKVSHLVLYGGFPAGIFARDDDEVEKEKRKALITLMRLGWGQENPLFRQIFTSMFIPGATAEQMDAFNELQRRTASAECAARYYEASARLDVRHLLDKVTAPTLVMHPRGDANIPVELGRQLAAGIPGARFVALPGQNHLFLEDEPAADRFFEELRLFLST